VKGAGIPIELILFLTFFCLIFPSGLQAQYVIDGSLISSGGGLRSGNMIIYDSLGEPLIGVVGGSTNVVGSGFWYLAGQTSAVDVAVEAFEVRLREESVIIAWTLSENSSFSGINIYRSDDNGEFQKLNESPIDPECLAYKDEAVLPGHEYRYKIGVIAGDYEVYSFDVTVSVPPKPLTLYQNYPNPFNPNTVIRFYLPRREFVSLEIFSVKGELVKVLVNRICDEGKYSFVWNGLSERGEKVSSGIYFYRLRVGKSVITKKMVLLR